MPTLFIVSTPIGNLEDITLRALRILRDTPLIAAEDTRVTRKLLARHSISTPLLSLHAHNEPARIPAILDALAKHDVALVTDAGSPTLSDPGAHLVRAAAQAGCPVVPIPGPSAITAALSASGLPADTFTFLGFLPRRSKDRLSTLKSVVSLQHTLVIFEAPHRLQDTLQSLLTALGDRPIAVCRELTKLHEEIFRGSISDALAHFTAPRGEFTLVIEGSSSVPSLPPQPQAIPLHQQLAALKAQGLRAKDAVAQVTASTGLPKRDVYKAWLELGKQAGKGVG
ncbi:MAG: 16S rRNA (cytidine(1402)-2'-O)-methyltransferase [SAR202 cluster bacterium]|nr:16S rRNA (cytidine(1402)-2'-O)-methyltransferase [SAR202 cluster bacterium]